ncbi:ABC transporter substrate-binding protein [Pseudorhodoplanes sinuspersici]|uniref:Nitrate ABC transporter substrate-binding protein n=1 Tax=Pseudorhodoplanes sinuspersici TaxID=1235591 RepID=A0A1W6ZYZ6_9HYPH|nr:ABC transporter substrate-binding protein [Pseudorhodoplanes sinuspersici]ARQ02627.1 nitrate ABC transporter substrate-binding protein [Pseudorhodoplanes sinuspersici]RKE74492.1 NitT/TauT family transport system substrate-binding protein [Pseudorhodoplanes sinuspersici]
MATRLTRRTLLLLLAFAAGPGVGLGTSVPAAAADKITFLTSWYAQAEHGGFYQAKATGLYEKAGIDATIRMGGPQVNAIQLLLAGEVDMIMGYDIQVLKGIEQGLPVVTVGASFQYDLQGMMTHDDVKSLAGLKDKTILIASSGRTTWWPWLKKKFNYADEQTKAYTFNLQPFFADKNIAQQAYPSSEPFQAQQNNAPAKFFLFAADGYPPYGTTMVTTRKFLEANPDLVKRFVRASLQGWKDYISNPGPANVLIKEANPKMSDAQIAFGIQKMKELKVLDGGDAATQGIGVMTEERWKKTYDYLVEAGLLKPGTDWKRAFTTEFVKDLKIMM